MIYLPVTLLLFLLFLLLLPFLWFALAIDVVQIAVAKLGFARPIGLLLLALIILGSAINIPLYRIESEEDLIDDFVLLYRRQFLGIPFHRIQRTTVVALNVGGGLIPIVLALYQFRQAPPMSILAVTAVVSVVSYYAAHIVPGIGIQLNPLVPPLAAALSAMLISNSHASAIAFAGGILGTLIGADILHLKDISKMSAGVLSIGGAGVFDGIALCGLLALLLT
ncbi:DUF1614 domain-containing protein [Pseudanabaena sp. PCC 6802]|uniref:DUF1614 domain-containing protein n=1 Tax=Pseudanabaena sp. PCC 6802 TaxID=118173 RepID=UPI00034D4D72|nr:DUF1614 domain-containing protein [Pseudanabaena sp. PCC 6802]